MTAIRDEEARLEKPVPGNTVIRLKTQDKRVCE